MTMLPDDDFLLFKPARRESVTIVRIALMALLGCLLLLFVLVIQARAQPATGFQHHSPAIHKTQPPQHPLQSYGEGTNGRVNPS
ncbi:hypothetical protein [Hoeflea ulvae]|uniref:Uncharacterized protein n=1 Tax=Hoeflea ulvae TaxID=2983764 RepID=A0ABT3YKI6_9HYPH|nr:hypothetical protein [Hoeflea ulvae]MCY0096137.1 hypothetical protein [Hoeflea ulvae]